MKIEIEIGENLKELLMKMQIPDTTEELRIVMETLERMFEKQQIYVCSFCGSHHYVGDMCPYGKTNKRA
jgi:rubrerythrin